ncbi:SH3 domain-containing protein, partial [Flavobacterium sp. B17]|uniref:SH3 domain-containing protein n=1 Tax=Flavobacterium sp. B17 TaxID=95618 RepID=UPI0011D290B3
MPEESERNKKCRIESVNTFEFFIEDPDGFTNLRKEKNASSEILQKIKSGENIEVLDNTGDWFLVKTQQGNRG